MAYNATYFYITIDDAPSKHTPKKLAYLKQHNIPTIFYCRGEFIDRYKHNVIEIIKAGFPVGNHSYSHPFYSTIDNQLFFDEILRTEKLIDECYRLANVQRNHKIIRLPFGDRGSGENCKMPSTHLEKIKYEALQTFLKEQGFKRVKFIGFEQDLAIDSPWSLDVQDYKKAFIDNMQAYEEHFTKLLSNSTRSHEILLLHDFDTNQHLFESAMSILADKEIIFLQPKL